MCKHFTLQSLCLLRWTRSYVASQRPAAISGSTDLYFRARPKNPGTFTKTGRMLDIVRTDMFLACHQRRSPFFSFLPQFVSVQDHVPWKVQSIYFCPIADWELIKYCYLANVFHNESWISKKAGKRRVGWMKWWMGWSQEKWSMYWCIKEVKNKLYQLNEDGFENCYNKGSFNEIHTDAMCRKVVAFAIKCSIAIWIQLTYNE